MLYFNGCVIFINYWIISKKKLCLLKKKKNTIIFVVYNYLKCTKCDSLLEV